MGPLCAEVVTACRALAPRVRLPVADAVTAVADRAAATPSLVVTGPVSSGKSTLVNALVGRRVAPTGAGECTRLVARYVRGPVDRLDVVLADGTHRPLPLVDDGRVPAAVGDRLGVDPGDVDHLLVTLTSSALDGLTVVDTPGTASARRSGRQDPGDALTDADAALVVLPATAHPGDLAALASAARRGPGSVVAVLGRADTVDDAAAPDLGAGGSAGRVSDVATASPGTFGVPDDAAAADGGAAGGGERDGTGDGAARTARALSARLGREIGPVLPVAGLLAETAVTGALRTEDRRALAALAAAPPDDLAAALLDAELFTSADLPVPPAGRARLLELLDRRGIAIAVAVLRADPEAGVGELCRELHARSGLDRLVGRLADEVRARADLLAATAALRRLEAIADRAGGPGSGLIADPQDAEDVRDTVQELRADPTFAELALLDACARWRAGALALPDDLAAELIRLATPGSPADRIGGGASGPELAGQAARRAAWWRSYAVWGTPRERREVAYAVHRAYLRLWRELTAPASPAPTP